MELAYFYTLSALLQGFAALVAFGGVFAIFRVDSLQREIDGIVSYWRAYLSKTGRLPDLPSPDEIFSRLSQYSKRYDSQAESLSNFTINEGIAKYNMLRARMRGLGRYVSVIMVFAAAVVFLCMWLLPWAKFFSEGEQIAVIIVVSIVASLSLYATVIAVLYWFGIPVPNVMFLGIMRN